MAFLKNSSPTSAKKPSQTWDHMPRRRKRHNRIMLVLLILVNCCSTFILCVPDVQVKDLDATVFKGENMLGNDRHNTKHFGTGNVLAKGEDNAEADKINDKDTSERIQLKKSENQNDDNSERSSQVIEMIQPSHTLRHQEHYKQQQQKQQQQQHNTYPLIQKPKEQNDYQYDDDQIFENNSEDSDDVYDNDNDNDYKDNDDDAVDMIADNEYKSKKIQETLKEPITLPTPHHRRHENHLVKKRLTKQTELRSAQHHLRHQHQHQNQHHQQDFSDNRQPQLRNLNHEMEKENLTNHHNLKIKSLHQRYFDRDSLYTNPFASIVSTEGPRLRHSGPKRHWQPINLSNNDAKTTANQMKDIKRFSLSLDTNENKNNNNSTNEKVLLLSTNEDDKHYDFYENANDNKNIADQSANDDYSYEDDDDDKEDLNGQIGFSSVPSTNAKTNVKRYTNPLRSLYKPSLHNQHSNDNDNENVENNEKHNKTSSHSSTAEFSSNISNNDDDKFSDEKWNKIEHEHFRKQLQHQRAMQALRYRRPINNISLPPQQYSSYTTNHNNAWTKRQTVNNDDEDNIYSRYYVPGTMTRKKEEELGSPTAILETRRQYALQQRQNKALASAHHRRIVSEGFCRLPQPRVERIRKDSWKIYTPHCTILHRCADDAGCCPSERQTCAPKRTKSVDLYFFVISLNETQGSIEKLTFVNHTECHCVDRSKQRAPEYGNSRSKEFLTNNQIPYLRRATILNCYCPNLFEKILQEDGYCRCDCSSGNMGCDWLKRGMEHFSMNDRKCIIEGRCKLPTCEYGQYIKKHGRCPRREERHLSADVDW